MNHSEKTAIGGLEIYSLIKHKDERGYFRETFSKKHKVSFLRNLNIRQLNHSHNNLRGVTRGIHAEPWDKYIWVTRGEVFAAFVDLRRGNNFGTTVTINLNDGMGVFVPRGVGNSYQTLCDDVDYCYAVNGLWKAGKQYDAINVADPQLNIDWPIPLSEAIVSEKDLSNPTLRAFKAQKKRHRQEVYS